MVDSIAGGDEQARVRKRRRVRRGTQSCWECKRRKIRCTFVAPTESVCDGCKSRLVECISQEFYVELDRVTNKMNKARQIDPQGDLAGSIGRSLPSLKSQDRISVVVSPSTPPAINPAAAVLVNVNLPTNTT